MALEPITRQEKIIAGQDLTPITRMEMFLKEYGGSGGGVSPEEVAAIVKEQFPQIKYQFIVTFSTTDMKNWTCDKTLAEITEAINSGKEVVGSLMGKTNVDFLEQTANGNAAFGRVFPDLKTLMSYYIIVSENAVEVTTAYIKMTAMGE